MNEKNNFSNVQRLNSAIMAKYQWTSSLIGMQKSGKEIHDRRTKTYRKANQFLQELLQKRSDGSLIDDDGIIDRYNRFLKFKSNFDDDDILDEFNRRLRALNHNRRNQVSRSLKSSTTDSQTTDDIEDRLKSLTITSSLNNSMVSTISSDETQTNFILNTDEQQLSSLEQSSTSSLNSSISKTLYRPKARRADGTEVIVNSTETPLHRASSDVLIFHHCYFPRSLTSRVQNNTNTISERPLSSSPIEQYDNKQLFHLLDQIETENSSVDFTTILDQLTLSSIQTHQSDDSISLSSDGEDEDQENIFSFPNLFDQSSLFDEYYTTFTLNINDPRKLFIYTMTIGIVQLSPSLTIPYSLLNGRRPLLQCSIQTNFKRIRSKRQQYNCQVTAIESFTNMKHLKENDIILKINDQSVWHLTTDDIRNILQKHNRQSNNCILTIARLCQPFL